MQNVKSRIYAILFLTCIVPIGLYTKFYHGYAAFWVNNSLGGVMYEIFWCLVVFLFYPALRSFTIAAGVFVVTCILEILQLWHPYFLTSIRSTFIGQTIFGTTFVWADFLYYLIGSLIGLLIVRGLQWTKS